MNMDHVVSEIGEGPIQIKARTIFIISLSILMCFLSITVEQNVFHL